MAFLFSVLFSPAYAYVCNSCSGKTSKGENAMYNRRYEKVFLMLRQETAGYALGKRPPWGSCVMEIKNGQESTYSDCS